MFKQLLIFSALMAPSLLLADSGESRSFQFQGQQQESFTLRGEITHTEYRIEEYASTCYREVFSHYETRCHSVPERVCYNPIAYSLEGLMGMFVGSADAQARPRHPDDRRPGPGHGGGRRPDPGHGGGGGWRPDPGHGGGGHRPPPPRCHTEYRRVCNQHPVYYSEPYTCYKTRTVSFPVKDADVLAHVKVDFDRLPDGLQVNDTFTVSLSGRSVTLSAQGANQVVYFLNKNQSENSDGRLVQTEVNYQVVPRSAVQINGPVARGITELQLSNGVISFMIGSVSAPETVIASLKIEKKKFLGDKDLIDRDLSPHELVLVPMGDRTRVEIPVSNLGMSKGLEDGKFEITAKVRLNVRGNIANPQAVSTLQPQQVVEVKLK